MKSNAFLHSIYAVLLLVFLGMGSVYAQLPGIPYQAYIMDKNAGYAVGEQLTNIPLANSQVMLQFEIRNAAGVEYAEQISVPTDAYGLLSTTIGAGIGTVTTGSFAGIAWDGTKKTLYAKIDFSNTGNAFEDHGMVELHYMPAPNLPEAEGLTTSTGAPTATNPAGAEAGDIYVDESTGDVFTYADTDGDGTGDTWISQTDAAGNSFAVTDAAADITLDDTHDILWVDATAGDINVTLPAASSVSGRAYTVVKADGSANNLVFSETITGSAFTFTQVNVPGSYRLQSNGTNWLLLK